MDRVRQSALASHATHTMRAAAMTVFRLGPGVHARLLYQSVRNDTRPGEPLRARLLECLPGANCALDGLGGPGSLCEWLVIEGDLELLDERQGITRLRRLDHWRSSAPVRAVRSSSGARAYLREAPAAREPCESLQGDAPERWADFAPGIARRLLWTDGSEASMLYRAAVGAGVPGHGHRLDEECLMLEGEVFVGDVLLRPGDYQLAPSGTRHSGVSTDTGGLLFAHGDLHLDVLADTTP